MLVYSFRISKFVFVLRFCRGTAPAGISSNRVTPNISPYCDEVSPSVRSPIHYNAFKKKKIYLIKMYFLIFKFTSSGKNGPGREHETPRWKRRPAARPSTNSVGSSRSDSKHRWRMSAKEFFRRWTSSDESGQSAATGVDLSSSTLHSMVRI